MKRYIYICLAIIITTASMSLSYAFLPWDMAYHALPTSITFDIPEEVAQISGNLQSIISQGKQIELQAKSYDTSLKSAVTSIFNRLKSGAILPVESNPGGIGATFCQKDIKDVSAKQISQKMRKTFFTYKSRRIDDINEQTRLRNRFYLDSIYAINHVAASLREKVETDISSKIELAKACAEGNGALCGFPSTDEGGNNEVLFAYGQTLEAFDSVIRVWESVAALKAQLKALQVMQQITPQYDYSEEDSEDASATDAYLTLPPFLLHQSQEFAFAQVSYQDTVSSLSELEAEVSGADSELQGFVEKIIEFSSPKEADNEHPLIAAEDKLEALSSISPIEEMVNSAMSAHNMLASLKEDKQTADHLTEMYQDYDKHLQRLKKSEQCAINYLGDYFANPTTVWSGIALGDNVNNHELRSGISAWAIDAYDTAKAAETSTVSSEDIAQISLDSSTLDDLADDPDMSKAQEESQKVKTSINVSKQEEADEENRKSSLLSWQIGAEASKILGASPSSWGTPKGKSMVWADTKTFYEQYLRRKYDNIKNYLKSYTREDLLALVISRLKGGDEDITETKYQQQLQKLRDEAFSKLDDAEAASPQYDEASLAKLNELANKRKALVADMDKVNSAITSDTNEISDLRSVAEDTALQKLDEKVNAKVVYPAVGDPVPETSVEGKIMGAEKMSLAVSQAREENIDNDAINNLETRISSNQSKLDGYQAKLDQIDNEIALTRLSAQAAASSLSGQNQAVIDAIKAAMNEKLQQTAKDYAADVRENLLAVITDGGPKLMATDPLSVVVKAEQAADDALSILYAEVDAIVDAAYAQIIALGDDLYNSASYPQVIAIHEQMIDNLKALTIAYTVAGYINLDNLAVYAKLLPADITPETEGFFVGATAKERDLKAPYAMPDFNLPPVREVFHFDSTDFANVKPVVAGNTNRDITASDFLNFGGDIPVIWRHMLQKHAFIESDFNLKDALSIGCEDVAFSRGGIMPCVVKGSTIVLDVNANGEYLKRTDLDVSTVPECPLMDIDKGKPHHTFWDAPVKIAQPTLFDFDQNLEDFEPVDRNCPYSELGMLLEADENNNLRFRQRAFDAYNSLLQDNGDEDLNDKQKNALASANQAMLSRNQIGDFLRYVETEKMQRENLEEYQQKYDDRMNAIKESLITYGFEPSEDFDLRNDADYELAEQKLQEIKSSNTLSALAALLEVDQTDNEPVQEKVGILTKLISILQKDTQNLLKISITMADSNDIEAELKKAEADNAVVDKYKSSLKDQADDYNESDNPYCANY